MAYKFFQIPTPENIERAAAINDASHKDGLRKCSGICGQVSANMNIAAEIPQGKYIEEFIKCGGLVIADPCEQYVIALWKNAFILGVLAGQLQAGVATEFGPPEVKGKGTIQ